MRTMIDESAKCDAMVMSKGLLTNCPSAVESECGCSRCNSEPLVTERFHACRIHREEAGTIHQRVRDRQAEWWQGRLVPPSALTGTWNTDGTWGCRCPIRHTKEHVACRHCYQTRPDGEPIERVRRGFYRHYGNDDWYYVTSVSIADEHGHGNVDAPRNVNYESKQSAEHGFTNTRTEAEFTALVKWPDGVMRPRFVRVKP